MILSQHWLMDEKGKGNDDENSRIMWVDDRIENEGCDAKDDDAFDTKL